MKVAFSKFYNEENDTWAKDVLPHSYLLFDVAEDADIDPDEEAAEGDDVPDDDEEEEEEEA